jgi:hypothetical protein
VQSVPITTKVVGLNPIHDKVYSIQYYVIKFVSDLLQVSGFLQVFQFPPVKNMAAIVNSCFWLAEIEKKKYSETTSFNDFQMMYM